MISSHTVSIHTGTCQSWHSDSKVTLMGTDDTGLGRAEGWKPDNCIILDLRTMDRLRQKEHPNTLLFDMADTLNLNLEPMICPAVMGNPAITCPCNCTGYRKLLCEGGFDVLQGETGIHMVAFHLFDFSIPTNTYSYTLFAATLNSTAPDMWVYINVFGGYQWAMFVVLLVLVVTLLWLNNFSVKREFALEFRTKRGSQFRYKLDSLLSGVALIGLFTIQMGSQPNGKHIGTRLLTLTVSLLTFLMFVYYANDITSEMTSGPPRIPVRSFDDVVNYGYKVITSKNYERDLLSQSERGTSKYIVWSWMLQFNFDRGYTDKTSNFVFYKEKKDFYRGVASDSKTLLWTSPNLPAHPWYKQPDWETKELFKSLTDLKISDGAETYDGLTLNKHSDFLQIMNYHIMQRYEHGIQRRHLQKWYEYRHDPNEEFGMLEPQPLGYNNVMFPFLFLGMAICAAVAISMVESGVNRWLPASRPKKPQQEMGVVKDEAPVAMKNDGQDNSRGGEKQSTSYENKKYMP